MKRLQRITIIALVIAAAACAQAGSGSGNRAGSQPVGGAGDGSGGQPGLLGSVRREADTVEHGAAADALQPVTDEVTLLPGDVLRVTEGGEGLLTFPDGMLLRLFNDTRLNIVAVESDPGSPIDVRMFLEDGGFTGGLTAEGGRAVFETPGGAAITVLGTDFFVVYDPTNQQTAAGNFGGHVEVAGAGQSVTLADGEFVEVPDSGPPGPPLPLTIDRAGFERTARAEASPRAALQAASRWQITIIHRAEVEADSEVISGGDASVFDWAWMGVFTESGGRIAGEGETVIGGNTLCDGQGETRWDLRPIGGAFDFEIDGSVIPGPEGAQFAFDLAGSPVSYSQTPGCSYHTEQIAPQFDNLSANPETFSEPIVVPARDGASRSISFTADTPPFWFGVPMEVTVEALP